MTHSSHCAPRDCIEIRLKSFWIFHVHRTLCALDDRRHKSRVIFLFCFLLLLFNLSPAARPLDHDGRHDYEQQTYRRSSDCCCGTRELNSIIVVKRTRVSSFLFLQSLNFCFHFQSRLENVLGCDDILFRWQQRPKREIQTHHRVRVVHLFHTVSKLK